MMTEYSTTGLAMHYEFRTSISGAGIASADAVTNSGQLQPFESELSIVWSKQLFCRLCGSHGS